MKQIIRSTCFISLSFLIAFTAFGAGNVKNNGITPEKTFIKNNKQLPNEKLQRQMREGPAWANFVQKHEYWQVEFNETNGKPHRAYGNPIPTTGNSPESRAINFVNTELQQFNIPVGDLKLAGTSTTRKHCYVNYTQEYHGLKVLLSRYTIKMTLDYKVIMFGADVYDDINISTNPIITGEAAITYAQNDLTDNIVSAKINPDLFILPIPKFNKNDYRLVYEVEVSTIDEGRIPARYKTWVDANDGTIWYRQNLVKHVGPPAGNVEVDMTATIYLRHSYAGTSVEPLPNLRVNINSTNYNTDANGNLVTSITTATTGTSYLDGFWANVQTAGNTPSFTTSLAAGPNALSFDTDATIQERTAYYHVNVVHDYCKSKLPSFVGMDFSLTTNIDLTTGDCNAFYNGSSINFYADGNGCLTYATVADVIYHEYGHGINDNFYQSQFASFNNGAIGEGYSDVWAFAITEFPVVGRGGSDADSSSFIRRYDIDPKIYPKDIVGQVHADGEIIAGAWWDLYLNLGSDMDSTMDLFTQAYYGLQATAADGNEGQAFRDILLDVLQADDNDFNLFNGTPNSAAICDAFGQHGITLISNASLVHTVVLSANGGATIPIDAVLNVDSTTYLGAVKMFYKIGNGSWNNTIATNTGGNNYSASIPQQPEGTIVSYYIGVEDNVCGNLSTVLPVGAGDPEPNIPHNILVGYQLVMANDFDFNNFSGSWTYGFTQAQGDSATTGMWELAAPVGMYDNGFEFAPTTQHTPSGFSCAVTEVNSDPNGGVGEKDVDGGRSTLESPVLNLSNYLNPVISYYRWFSNDPPSSANPGNDPWYVTISGDGGSTWVPIENTYVSDNSWRRVAFRVSDYVTPSSTVQMRFMVSDSILTYIGPPGCGSAPFCGGSLVEAALDDIEIWEQTVSSFTATISSTTDVSCNGGSDGAATVAGVAGSTPYTYSWVTTPVQTNATATGLAAGTYDAIITDAGGNTDTVLVTITEPTALGITTSSTTANCGNSDGTATATVSGGTTPYTYLWDDGNAQTGAVANNLADGTYNAAITDGNGCTASSGAAIVSSTPAVVFTTGQNLPSTCGASDGQIAIATSSGTTPFTYQWDDPASQTTSTATGLMAGTYNVTVTDANGCTSIEQIALDDPGTATVSIPSSTNASCFGVADGTADVQVAGGTGPFTYSWNDGNTQTTASATGLAAGTYTATVIDGAGCLYGETITITEPSQLVVGTPTVTDVSTNGGSDGSATVTPSGGTSPYTYNWNTGGSIQTTATATGLSAGTYNVTITDANGCSTTQIATVSEPPVGIAENSAVIDLNVYPNPTNGFFYVEYSNAEKGELTIRMFNTVGQVVFSDIRGEVLPGDHKIVLDANNLANGIYLLNMTVGEKVYSHRVSVMR